MSQKTKPLVLYPKYKVTKKFVKMFGCNTARISKPLDRMFLILGHNRNTAKDREEEIASGKPGGQWIKTMPDGTEKLIDFDYVEEKVIASGRTIKELMASALEYKRLCGITMEQYILEKRNAEVVR